MKVFSCTSLLALLIMIPLAVSSTSHAGAAKKAPPSKAAPQPLSPHDLQRKIGGSVNAFGIKILKEIDSKSKVDNVLVSPFSMAMSLGMTQNGAKGATLDEMRDTLALSGLSDSEINSGFKKLYTDLTSANTGTKLEVGNSIWIRLGLKFKPKFTEDNEQNFYASTNILDFNSPSAKDTINKWVATKTHEMIPSIIDESIDNAAMMFLINAIYFDGKWESPFDKNKTASATFTQMNGQKKQVKMMHLSGDDFSYMKTPLFEAIELPYQGEKVRMAIFLPDKQRSTKDFLKELSIENWTQWTSSMFPQKGTIAIPRFEIEYASELSDTLKVLGMRHPFGKGADFSRMSFTSGLYIGKVLHKTRIRVNEEGTQAAAATSTSMDKSIPKAPFSFVADRPFVLFIYGVNTGAMLFSGIIGDPLSL